MFTTIDKALVALLGAVIFLVSQYTDLEPDFISEELLQSVSAVVSSVLVYFVPNKKKE